MAIPHAKPGELFDVRPLEDRLAQSQTETQVKTDTLEVIRLVLPAGKEISQHSVAGEITLQCIEGNVSLTAGDKSLTMTPGSMLYLHGSQPHSLKANEDSSLVLTILLQQGAK